MFRTMLVEDNVIFRESLRDNLRLRFPSMEMIEAGNAEEALEKIGSQPPDVIFMDIRLPGQSGLELTAKIKRLYPDIMIIILTSYNIPEYREAAARFKADHFFAKDSMAIEEIAPLVESRFSHKKRGGGGGPETHRA